MAKQVRTIQELTATQRPAVVPEKRKIKYVDKIVEKVVKVKDEKCTQAYEELHKKTLQCAYNLKFCQEQGEMYYKLKPESKE